jgi:hypothetical protein
MSDHPSESRRDESASSPIWVKSSLSFANGNCVAVTDLEDGYVGVRDTKDPEGSHLRFTPSEWQAFLGGVRNGEFDRFGNLCSLRAGRIGVPLWLAITRHRAKVNSLETFARLCRTPSEAVIRQARQALAAEGAQWKRRPDNAQRRQSLRYLSRSIVSAATTALAAPRLDCQKPLKLMAQSVLISAHSICILAQR